MRKHSSVSNILEQTCIETSKRPNTDFTLSETQPIYVNLTNKTG